MKHQDRSGKMALVCWKGGAIGEEPIEDCLDGEPKRIMVGAGQVPPGIDEILFAMDVGATESFIIPAMKAYGAHDPDGVQTYPRWYVPGGYEAHAGDMGTWVHPESGMYVPIRCIAATEDTITIDFNHPLAGKDLEYRIHLLATED
ncbi:MAG: FKBP-type peptidyl-prolyl cis-trans isomerase [Eggerthellaceae bacterium]|nr:FKBP-type peptidyl-prolyl cis-trans isomerase [Eggerthellaceae bacterium]